MNTYVLPPPVGGWNTRDRLGEMKDDEATLLDNWEPEEGSVRIRPGYEVAVTLPNAGEYITDMISFKNGTVSQIFIQTADPANSRDRYYTYENGVLTFQFDVFPLSTAKMSGVRFDDKYIWGLGFVNLSWLGNSKTLLSISDPSSSTIAGLRSPIAYRGRLFFITAADQAFYYGGPQAIQGTFTKFDIGLVASVEGTQVGHTTISRDGGAGPDDYYCALFSEGHVVVYTGTDPGDVANWSLVGVYKGSPPLLDDGGFAVSLQKIGGDTIVLTEDGYVSLSALLTYANSDYERTRISEKIGPEIRKLVSSYGRSGWQVVHYPRRDWLIITTPETNSYSQHIYKIDRKVWFRTNYPMTALCDFGGDLYFGTPDGKLCKLGGLTDNGSPIYAEWWTSNTACRKPDREKIFGWATPLVSSNADYLDIGVTQGINFADPPPVGAYSEGQPGSPWNTDLWDVATWGKSPTMQNRRFGLSGHGYRTSIAVTCGGPGLDARCHGVQIGYETARI